MKKIKLVGWPIVLLVSILLMGVSVFFAFTQQGLEILKWPIESNVPFYVANAFNGSKTFLGLCKNALLQSFITPFVNFSLSPITIAFYACFGVSILLMIVQIIYFAKSKKPSMIFWIIVTLMFAFGSMMVCVTVQQYFGASGEYFIDKANVTEINGYKVNQDATIKNLLLNPNAMFGGQFAKKGLVMCGLAWLFIVSVVLFVISYLVIFIQTLVYAKNHKFDKELANSNANDEINYDNVGLGGTTNNINTVGNSSPLIVQYINSYGPDTRSMNNNCSCQCNDQTPTSYGNCNCSQHIQNVEEEKPLTKEDVENIINNALKETKETKEEVSYQNDAGEELEYVDLDDLKNLIKDQVSTAIHEVNAAKSAIEDKKEVDLLPEETSTYDEKPFAKDVKVVSADNDTSDIAVDNEKTKVKLTTPIVVAVPTTFEPEKETDCSDCDCTNNSQEEAETLTEDEIRNLVSEELKSALKDFAKPKQKKIIKKIINKEVPEYIEEEKLNVESDVSNANKETSVSEEPTNVIETPISIEKEVTVESSSKDLKEENKVSKEVPLQEEKPAEVQLKVQKNNEVRGKESTIEKGEVVRLNFFERIASGDDLLKSNYNAIKNLLMSYGLKDRLSNTGDTFRLHKVTYAKITCLGDSLKIYLALDPKDYVSTALPIQDVSSKDSYKDIPLGFKVRSDLSLRRANELIQSTMRKANLEALSDYQVVDFAKEIEDEVSKKVDK